MENTINDFWRMIWEQNSKVIIMATDLSENGVEKCAEYLPPSVVLDNNRTFGDFQVMSRRGQDSLPVQTLPFHPAAHAEEPRKQGKVHHLDGAPAQHPDQHVARDHALLVPVAGHRRPDRRVLDHRDAAGGAQLLAAGTGRDGRNDNARGDQHEHN